MGREEGIDWNAIAYTGKGEWWWWWGKSYGVGEGMIGV
jgi:hypothetical protein